MCRRHHPLTSTTTAADIHVRIVGTAHEAVAAPFQFLVHLVEQHVSQQRRISRIALASPIRFCRRSIRMSWLTRSKNFSRSTSTTIHRPDYTYDCAASTASCARRPGRKPQLCSLKEGSQNRLQHLLQRLLHQPVRYRRDARLALTSVRFRHHQPPYRTGPVRPLQQNCSRIAGHAVTRSRDVWSMSRRSTPSGSLVGPYPFKRVLQVLFRQRRYQQR
ncbi:hypothetical protein OKW45_004067 [Paraburkholderia sp. WSM4175]